MDPRRRVPLAATGLAVTQLGLGTAPLGGLYEALPELEALAIVERGCELGLRFFDTAPLYGFGLAERRLGQALRDKPRAAIVVATKAGVQRASQAEIEENVRMFEHEIPGALWADLRGEGPLADDVPVPA